MVYKDTATTEIYTLSLHDALPISKRSEEEAKQRAAAVQKQKLEKEAQDLLNQATQHLETWIGGISGKLSRHNNRAEQRRSEEHTSELQSHVNLVCRLLLEKKKKKK